MAEGWMQQEITVFRLLYCAGPLRDGLAVIRSAMLSLPPWDCELS